MKRLLSVILTLTMVLSAVMIVPTVNGIRNVDKYRYVKLSDTTVKIVKYLDNEKYITARVPSRIDGMKVVAIGRMAFANNNKIKYVGIPNSVKEIGKYAFSCCESLKKVWFGKGVTKLPEGIFIECNKMTNFTIPPQVTSVGKGAFPFSIKTLTIGKGLKSIGRSSIYGIENLREIKVSSKNKYFKSKSGVLYNKNMTELIAYPMAKKGKSFTIPAKVKTIGTYSFASQNYLKKVDMSKGVKTVKRGAFMECEELESINIPKNVTLVGMQAFAGCRNVKNINFDANKKLKIKRYAFGDNDKIKSLTVPKVSGTSVFESFCSLKNIYIPSNVKSILERQFFNCPKLTDVTIPKTVTKIGKKSLGYISDGYGDGSEKMKKFTIRGYKGSAAERYAKKNGFKFIKIA